MNELIAWVTEKWLTQKPTNGQGYIIWYSVARYDHLDEVHSRLRYYEYLSPLDHKLSKPKADLEYRIRVHRSNGQLNYDLYEKEESGLKPIRSFTWEGDLILYLEASQR